MGNFFTVKTIIDSPHRVLTRSNAKRNIYQASPILPSLCRRCKDYCCIRRMTSLQHQPQDHS